MYKEKKKSVEYTTLMIHHPDGTKQKICPNEAFCAEAHKKRNLWQELAQAITNLNQPKFELS